MHLRIFLLLLSFLLPQPLLAGMATQPRLMLATNYRSGLNVSDYWVSEKLDGVRGRWDGKRLLTRSGQPITPPRWFTAGWPEAAMDGELWIGRGRFDEISGIVRAGAADDRAWRRVRFMVFDLPDHGGTFEARVLRMRTLLSTARIGWLQPVPQFRLGDAIALRARLGQVVADGGEGLMLHRRGALYRVGRSEDLIKYKLYEDAEARVVAHAPGKGKYAGMLGALVVQMQDGRRFRLGSGFTDAQRAAPPPIGSLVTYRSRERVCPDSRASSACARTRRRPIPDNRSACVALVGSVCFLAFGDATIRSRRQVQPRPFLCDPAANPGGFHDHDHYSPHP